MTFASIFGNRSSTTVFAAFLVILMIPSNGRSCSCRNLTAGAGRFYHGEGGALPGDASGLPWSGPVTLVGSTDRVSLLRLQGTGVYPVKYSIIDVGGGIEIIAPRAGVSIGDKFSIVVREHQWRAVKEIRSENPRIELPPPEMKVDFVISPETPSLQGSLLQLGDHSVRTIAVGVSPNCSRPISADAIALEVALPHEAAVFRDYFLYETRVDDAVWSPRSHMCDDDIPGRSWAQTAGADLIFTSCEAPRVGLDPGEHKVEIRVSSPDGKHTATAGPVNFTIGCNAVLGESGSYKENAAVQPGSGHEQPDIVGPVASNPPLTARATADGPPSMTSRGCHTGTDQAPPLFWLLLLAARHTRRRTRKAKDAAVGEDMERERTNVLLYKLYP